MITPFEINPDITKAYTIPTEWYRSHEVFDTIASEVFATSWQCVALQPDLKATNSAVPMVFLPGLVNEPLMVTTNSVGAQRVLSNVCTHRGTVLVNEVCALNEIRCAYHGRRFSLEGECIAMPEFKGVEGFPSPFDDLQTLEHYAMFGTIFTKLQKSGLSFSSFFQDITKRCGYIITSPIQSISEHEYVLDAHWALYVENYLEGFHIPFVHQGLHNVLEYNAYETHLLDRGVFANRYSKRK